MNYLFNAGMRVLQEIPDFRKFSSEDEGAINMDFHGSRILKNSIFSNIGEAYSAPQTPKLICSFAMLSLCIALLMSKTMPGNFIMSILMPDYEVKSPLHKFFKVSRVINYSKIALNEARYSKNLFLMLLLNPPAWSRKIWFLLPKKFSSPLKIFYSPPCLWKFQNLFPILRVGKTWPDCQKSGKVGA